MKAPGHDKPPKSHPNRKGLFSKCFRTVYNLIGFLVGSIAICMVFLAIAGIFREVDIELFDSIVYGFAGIGIFYSYFALGRFVEHKYDVKLFNKSKK